MSNLIRFQEPVWMLLLYLLLVAALFMFLLPLLQIAVVIVLICDFLLKGFAKKKTAINS